MTPEEIRAHAEGLIRDHATDIEWLTIGETLPESVPEDQADEVMKKVDDLIQAANVSVSFPGDSSPDGLTDEQLRDRMADAILTATYPPDEWPDGPPGEGEMDTARTEAAAAMNVVGPELTRLREQIKHWHDTYQGEVNARDEFFGHLLELLPGAEDTGMDAYDQIPRAIERLRAQVSGRSTARTIVETAVRKGYDIGGQELDDLAKALGLNGGEGQC